MDRKDRLVVSKLSREDLKDKFFVSKPSREDLEGRFVVSMLSREDLEDRLVVSKLSRELEIRYLISLWPKLFKKDLEGRKKKGNELFTFRY